MKKLIVLFAILAFSCKSDPVKVQTTVRDSVVYRDSLITIQRPDSSMSADSLRVIIAQFKRENDSLKTALFIAQYKVNRVRYYLNICLRNPSQDKWLKGWVLRAIK